VKVPDTHAIEKLVTKAGLGRLREVAPLIGGANNRVFRVECERGTALLKAYFRSQADPRDRLGAEFAFSRFVWSCGVRSIPQPLACDPATNLGLFEFVAGERPARATDFLVSEAIQFISRLSAARRRSNAATLPLASESCFSVEQHLRLVASRTKALEMIVPESDINREALRFVREEMLPSWEAIAASAAVEARSSPRSFSRTLDRASTCLSPSDFGFHNALVTMNGHVTFLDFEYAGWDDPAKLICDFFCQPTVPVPRTYLDQFAGGVSKHVPDPAALRIRCQLLMPVYSLKWICIRLNEFLPQSASRRGFSRDQDVEERKYRQLASARAALAHVMDRGRVPA